MKKIVITLGGIVLLAAWSWLVLSSHEGMRPLLEMSHYTEGLLAMESPEASDLTRTSTAGDASVYVDTLGIPHIYAQDEKSLGYALGYMHAKERYFQMELLSKTAKGRLAEMIGDAGLNSDAEWRALELETRAREIYEGLSSTDPALHQYLAAYTEGVNAFVASEDEAGRDPLYSIWDVQPGTWEAWNTFLIQWYVSSRLTYYTDYIDQQEMLDKVPAALREQFFAAEPVDLRTIIPSSAAPAAAEQPVQKEVTAFAPGMENITNHAPVNRSLGSNNWVISPARTRGGQTFLCNDPHLMLTAPQVFYEAHLVSPELEAYGYTIPGSPIVASGHNKDIAWGITNGGWDVTEMYLLETDEEHPNQYRVDGEWKETEIRTYTIQSKGQPDYEVTAEHSDLGIVQRRNGLVYTILWHPAKTNQAAVSFWDIMHARNWEDFRAALSDYDHPAQNFAFADRLGNIGMVCAGKMPIKPEGYAGGMLDGSKAPINAYIPFDSLPQAYNPEQGYIFSANQQPAYSAYHFSSHWFEDLYRPRRIDNLLAASEDHTVEGMQQIQRDVRDMLVADMQELLRSHLNAEELAAWEPFMQWEGDLDPKAAASLYYQVLRESIDGQRAGLAKVLQIKKTPSLDQYVHYLKTGNALKIDTIDWSPAIAVRNLSQNALERLQRYDIKTAGQASPVNPFAFEIPQITFLPGFETPVNNVGGSENTVNVNYDAHSVIRTVIALDSTGIQSWMITAGGQSGRVNSAQYLQQLPAWEQNQPHASQSPSDPAQLQHVDYTITFQKP